jgi:hypothetical protein
MTVGSTSERLSSTRAFKNAILYNITFFLLQHNCTSIQLLLKYDFLRTYCKYKNHLIWKHFNHIDKICLWMINYGGLNERYLNLSIKCLWHSKKNFKFVIINLFGFIQSFTCFFMYCYFRILQKNQST